MKALGAFLFFMAFAAPFGFVLAMDTSVKELVITLLCIAIWITVFILGYYLYTGHL